MWQQILPGLRIKIFMTIVLGIAYPLVMTGISQAIFPRQSNGSLVTVNGKVIGSELIGQNFTKPEYFHPRPSAAGNDGYDPMASGGSNLGPTNQKLIDRIKAAVNRFRQENPDYHGPIPADLLTTSASGLDPDISPDSALAQAARVAKARAVSVDEVNRLIAESTQQPTAGIFGEARVNVLKINLALDQRWPKQ
ncbi:MAG TPA: potassium-transporting ATPase subunit KdpC [Bryobacteraceae bacterium]|nr:potassium-transporting ATPase subunit KdpC [Bryobacteraceae bacterium]